MVESRENVENRRLRRGYVGILQEGRMLKELLELVGNSENLELYIADLAFLRMKLKKLLKNTPSYSSPNKLFEVLSLGIPVIVAEGTGMIA
jgi:hypothetical protein